MRLLSLVLILVTACVMNAQSSFQMDITVNGRILQADMTNCQAAEELKSLLEKGEIAVSLHEYGGFERVGSLPQSFTRSDQNITAQSGDIVLYQGNQIVFMLGSNSWNYTRLGHIDANQNTLESFFGSGECIATLSLNEVNVLEVLPAAGSTDEIEYYDLQGRRIIGEPRGLVIQKKGNTISKVFKR